MAGFVSVALHALVAADVGGPWNAGSRRNHDAIGGLAGDHQQQPERTAPKNQLGREAVEGFQEDYSKMADAIQSPLSCHKSRLSGTAWHTVNQVCPLPIWHV